MTKTENNHLDGIDSKLSSNPVSYFKIRTFFNILGLVGTVMNIWYFADTLYKIYSGEPSLGVYLQVGTIIIVGLICLSLAKYGLPSESGVVMFFSSIFGIIVSLMLITTFYVAVQVSFQHGFDLFIYDNSIKSYSFNPISNTGICIIMFIGAVFGETYFLKNTERSIKLLAVAPKIILLIYLLYNLVGKENLLKDFSGDITSNIVTGYVLGTFMLLVIFIMGVKQLGKEIQNNTDNRSTSWIE